MDTKYNSLSNLNSNDRWQIFPSTRMELTKSATYDLQFPSTQLRQKAHLYTDLSNQQRNSYQSDSTSPSSNYSNPTNADAYGQGELTMYQHNSDMADKLELQSLLAELEASRDLNKTLSLQLAKSERDYQSLKIQQELQHDHTEAVISARITEIISKQYAERKAKLEANGLKRSLSQSAPQKMSQSADKYASSDNLIDVSGIKNKEMQQILHSLNQPHLSPMEISSSCQAMLQYIKRHGCTVGVRNGSNGTQMPSAADLTQLRKENDKLTTKLASLTQNLTAMEDLVEKLRRQLAVSSGEKSDLESERDSMEAKVVHLQQQLVELKLTTDTQSDRLLEENHKYLMELSRVKSQLHSTSDAHVLAELEGQKRELSIQLEKIQQEKEELLLQRNTLESRLGDYEAQDGSLGRRRSLTAMNNNGNNGASGQQSPTHLSKELEQLKREKSALTQELSAAYSSLQDVQDGTHKLTGELTEKLNSETAESAKLRQQLSNTNDKCKFLNEEISRLTIELESVQKSNANGDQLSRENAKLIERLSTVQLQLSQTELELNSLKQERLDEADKLHKLSTTNLKLADHLSTLQAKLVQSEGQLEQLQLSEGENLSKMADDNKFLNDQLSTLKTKLTTSETEIVQMRKERESLKDTLANQSEALLAAKTAVSQSTAQLDSFKADRNEKELDKLRGKFEQQEAKWQHDLYELRQKYSDSESENFQLNQELMQLKRDCQELKEKFSKSQRDCELLTGEKCQLEANLKAIHTPTPSTSKVDTDQPDSHSGESLKLLRDEYKKLADKNDEQKRLIAVLRRKMASLVPPTH